MNFIRGLKSSGLEREIVKRVYSNVVIFSGIFGGFVSGVSKINDIVNEEENKYSNENFERPFRYGYNISRIITHTIYGGVISGGMMATVPISIPAYLYWKSHQTKTSDFEN